MIQNNYLKKILFNPWFIAISALKLATGSLLASPYMTEGFVPFLNYFITSGGKNPYDFFVAIDQPAAFPYPPIMLFILSIGRVLAWPFLSSQWESVTFGHLFVTHLPIFIADVFIYIVLCRWLETKERHVLWFYWASPILFFINYILGQLDVIPMAILFASLVMLFNRRPWQAAIILGLGIATKAHLIAVLPFYFIYWYVNRHPLKRTITYCFTIVGVLVIALLPYLWSAGFTASVFGTEEANKAYMVYLPYVHNQLKLLLAPACVVILFLNFLNYKKLNKDAFLLILTLLFTVFIVLVPPMPGWYYWSIPFMIYFFVKYKTIPQTSFWLMNFAYVGYVIFSQDSTILSSFQLLIPSLADSTNIYWQLNTAGFNMPLWVNSIFTLLAAAIMMNAIWIYRAGVRSNLEYKTDQSPLVIGVGGDSGAGKNTLVDVLLDLFGNKYTTTIEGDDAHKWERQDDHWQQHTHLDPKSNRLHDELIQTIGLKTGESIQRTMYDHGTGRFTSPNTLEGRRNIIYVGLHPFYLSKMRQLFTIKIYVEPAEALRRHWKILRDTKQRGRSKAEIIRQIEQREADANQYIRPQRQFADLIVSYFPQQSLVDDESPKVFLRLTCDNSIHLDPFMVKLTPIAGLRIEHTYDPDLHHQTIEFTGDISVDNVRQVAYIILPNLNELLQHNPTWRNNYEGIIQLFIAYYYSEFNKTK